MATEHCLDVECISVYGDCIVVVVYSVVWRE